MKFTKYKLIPLISLVALNFILTIILFIIKEKNREQIVYLWVLSIVPFLFLCLVFKTQEVLKVNHYAPVVFFLMSIIANIASIATFRKITLEEIGIRAMPVSAFAASFYWLFLRPKEKFAEENKKSAEDKKIEAVKKSEIKMKRQLLFFIPVAVLSPLITFITNLEDSSLKETLLVIVFQYATYFIFTLFFFVSKKIASPQRFKQLVVSAFLPCIAGFVFFFNR